MKTIGIIAAMESEMLAMTEQMKITSVQTFAGLPYYAGTIRDVPVVLCVCGVGKVNAAMHTQILIDRFSPDLIVQNGVAGSLCADVGYFDLVVGRELVYHDMQSWVLRQFEPLAESYAANEKMVKIASETIPDCKIGRIATGDQFISDPDDRMRIAEKTGALCTEMEGCAVAHTATLNGVPFLVLRAISDMADGSATEDFPTFTRKAADRAVAILLELLPKLAV
ncbi:MAG: 5'-methylthioadenosine/adenosylhomocysteine nucleosidase [Clostridia bacterium]|nr:5'-methylthioadenosine/adenosylhomocysteine nucleosidase [Clostridia bacterium]